MKASVLAASFVLSNFRRRFVRGPLARDLDQAPCADPSPMPWQRPLSLILSLLISTTLFSCSQNPVSIEKISPVIKTVYFDKGARPPEAKTPEHNDCANTHWHFGFLPEIGWELVKRERSPEGENVLIKIKSAKLTLKLDITMWLPEKASQDVIAHEKGHAAICLDAYKQAEKVAQDAANSMIGQKVEAHGPDYESTLKSALTNVYQDLARKYREETLDKANVTSALYDKITMKDHAASKVDSKVDDAELQYEHLAPEMKKQRAEEERIIRDMVEKQKRKFGRKQNAAPERKDPTAQE